MPPCFAMTLAIGGLCLVHAVSSPTARACTNFLITKGASSDGSTMISYAADSHELYGELYHLPAKRHPKGAMRKIFDWDSGRYIGSIKEVPRTYQVVGNMNEHQVAIGETTYGGREELKNKKGGMDYGSLMYVTLQRARTAREAVRTMGELVAEHGYCSSGESFSIADPNEVWIMEMIGKGPGHKGAVWVARRIPDGYISAHANQARIRRFPLDDPDNCLYAPDVIAFARQKGYFKGKDEEFSFADAYAPLTFQALRVCEARVWSMFRRAAPSLKLSTDYISGKEGAKPLPLWIKPDQRLSVRDVMGLMRDHFEGSDLDLHGGLGAGPYDLPYRWRPLTWEVDGVKYLNERATSTQQTGFSFVTQSRSWLPDPIGGIIWFGVDDTASTVYVPMYCGITRVPRAFAVGTASFNRFSWESAFWVFNWVSNFAYSRYRDMIKDIRAVQTELENRFEREQPEIEKQALRLYRASPARAIRHLESYSVRLGQETTTRYRELGERLLLKYLDGNVRDDKGKVTHPGYPKRWYRRIAQERGEHFRVRRIKGEPEPKEPQPRSSNQPPKRWWGGAGGCRCGGGQR